MHGHMNVKLVVISYRSFGTIYRSHLQGLRIQKAVPKRPQEVTTTRCVITQTTAVLMKLFITQFSPVSCHFLSLRLKAFLQQPFLRHPVTMFLLNYTRCVLLTVGHNLKVPHCRHVCNTKLQTNYLYDMS